jgi:hypothetical protein
MRVWPSNGLDASIVPIGAFARASNRGPPAALRPL